MTSNRSIGGFIKAPTVKKQKRVRQSTPDVIQESSSDSSDHGTVSYGTIHQEHARPRLKATVGSVSRLSLDVVEDASKTSLTSSITKFRTDFDQFQCKMRIFGESLNLCRCIADDFRHKLTFMEKRLEKLEKRQTLSRTASNYSAIIQKNKRLSCKTLADAKKLQMCGTEDEMREVAARICRNYLHGAWKTVNPKELAFKRISGGLSNFIYYIALPDDPCKLGGYHRESSPDTDIEGSDSRLISKKSLRASSGSFTSMEEPKKVLLRIYGQVHGERAMDAIVTESVIFTLLSERKLGPKLHGVFSGGRIEEYIPARSLMVKELADPAISMKIAEKMAAIHSMEVPLTKEPNWMWKNMGKWLKTVKEERLSGTISGKDEQEERIIKTLKGVDFDKEIEWLKKFLTAVHSPVVFCHNDLQEGNILYIEDAGGSTDDDVSGFFGPSFDSTDTRSELSHFDDANTSDTIISRISDNGEPRLVLIDFEYCAYNHRGFDMANHFQEWVYDYTNPEHPFYFEFQENKPTLEQKEIFIREYLKHYHSNQEDKSREPTLEDVNHLLDEVEAFALGSHLFWCLWSIVNASKSQIPFGYWEYGMSRLETYQRLKQEVIKKDKHGLPQKRKICEVDI